MTSIFDYFLFRSTHSKSPLTEQESSLNPSLMNGDSFWRHRRNFMVLLIQKNSTIDKRILRRTIKRCGCKRSNSTNWSRIKSKVKIWLRKLKSWNFGAKLILKFNRLKRNKSLTKEKMLKLLVKSLTISRSWKILL